MTARQDNLFLRKWRSVEPVNLSLSGFRKWVREIQIPKPRRRLELSKIGTANLSNALPTSKRHYRLRVEDAIEAHDIALTYGGRAGILSLDQLLSAIGRPYTGYYRPIHRKAAALAESICKNHAFVDGNKRTCFALVMLLLSRSDFQLRSGHGETVARSLEDLIVEIANGNKTFEQIEDWFQIRLRRKP